MADWKIASVFGRLLENLANLVSIPLQPVNYFWVIMHHGKFLLFQILNSKINSSDNFC